MTGVSGVVGSCYFLSSPHRAAGKEVIDLNENVVVILVLGIATFVVALLTFVLKLIEITRK